MQRCIGFGDLEGKCEGIAGWPSPPNDMPLWCGRCEEGRRTHITKRLEEFAGINTSTKDARD